MPAIGPVERYREAEAQLVQHLFMPGCRLLEIGAGSGYQASLLERRGCAVTALDVAPRPADERFFPVQVFDGVHLPFEDATFDVVFSSNVLEHVEKRSALLREIERVLVRGGLAVHIVPSATWRIWTALGRFVNKAAELIRQAGSERSVTPPMSTDGSRRSGLVANLVFGPPHGEYGSTLEELFAYRRSSWRRALTTDALTLRSESGNHIFYTGYALWPSVTLPTRRRLARFLGSSCHTFVLQRL
jgi:SAM-dependent methyltransferase